MFGLGRPFENMMTFLISDVPLLRFPKKYRLITFTEMRRENIGQLWRCDDDVMVTVLSNAAEIDGSMHSRSRQGHHDHRHLVMTKVTALADRLRTLQSDGHRLEHIHDY